METHVINKTENFTNNPAPITPGRKNLAIKGKVHGKTYEQ